MYNVADLCFESSKLELIIHQALFLWMRDLPSKFQMEDIFWEDVGNSLRTAEERCTVKCKGFPLDLTFVPSKFDLRNLQHDTLTEMLNIMPKWRAELWMTNVNVHNAVGLQSAGMIQINKSLDSVLHFVYVSLILFNPFFSSSNCFPLARRCQRCAVAQDRCRKISGVLMHETTTEQSCRLDSFS